MVQPTPSTTSIISTSAPITTSSSATTTTTPAPITTSSTCAVVPTPEAHTCPTPGTYTFTATTITVSETTTVCGATSTPLPSGTHTIGGVTTIVETSTTVTCPVATVSTSGSETTSTIYMTTYVCPSAGTYTIAPTTVTVTEASTVTYPAVTTYCPGTYTKPEEVVTVTETDYTTWCPFENVAPTTAPAAPATTYAAAPAPAPAKVAKPAPAAESPSSSSSSSGTSLTGTNDHYGITYTPYDANTGACKQYEEVEADLAGIKAANFQVVRVYSTDCSTLPNVGTAAEKFGLKLILGVFVQAAPCDMTNPQIKEQVDDISSWAQWSLVDLLAVGNEAIMNGFCTASELRELVIETKAACSGYTGPITISEPLNIWQEPEVSSAICGVVDVAGANIHAFFNSATTPGEAGAFVKGQMDILDGICEGKTSINLECGWPTAGQCNGVACPGTAQQAEALASIRSACGDKVVFFSHENDYWKAPGAFDCEQSWGVKDYFTQLLDTLGL